MVGLLGYMIGYGYSLSIIFAILFIVSLFKLVSKDKKKLSLWIALLIISTISLIYLIYLNLNYGFGFQQ